MDNFNVPKKVNRNVMKALSVLHPKHSITGFVPAQNIIHQVELQMRRTKKVVNLEHFVRKSLCSLTHLGVVVRTGTSEYALRQQLEFTNGVSAIPWKPFSVITPKPCVKKITKKRPIFTNSKTNIKKLKPVQRFIKKAAAKRKTTPLGIKPCRVVCHDILAKRKIDEMECDESLSRTCPHSPIEKSTVIDDSRWQFSPPIYLIDSQGY